MNEINIKLNDKKYKQLIDYAKINKLTPELLCEEYINNTLEEIEEANNIVNDKSMTYHPYEELKCIK